MGVRNKENPKKKSQKNQVQQPHEKYQDFFFFTMVNGGTLEGKQEQKKQKRTHYSKRQPHEGFHPETLVFHESAQTQEEN